MTYLKTITIALVPFLLFISCAKNIDSSNDGDKDFTSTPSVESLRSTEIGNGGDLIQCWPQGPNFPYPIKQGWYLLDYVEDRGGRLKYAELEELEDYLSYINDSLAKTEGEKSASFQRFLMQIPFIQYSPEETIEKIEIKREWVKTVRNEEIHDENPSYIPGNCRRKYEKGKTSKRGLMLHQIVVRKEFVDDENNLRKVQYFYDTRLIKKIGEKPLQMAMLLFHEWLWDEFQSDKSRQLRKVNRVFHSKNAWKLSGPELEALFTNKKPSKPRPRPKIPIHNN